MNSAQVLLKNICADPTDLDSRRVYADFLTEKGDPRGTFIALQLELEELIGDEENYPAMLAESHRLLAENAGKWLKVLPARSRLRPDQFGRIEINQHNNAIFNRGFLSRVAVMPERIDSVWKTLTKKEPLEGLEVIVPESVGDENRDLKMPSRFRTLKVSAEGWVTPNAVADVLRWGTHHLEELDLSGCDLGADGVPLLLGEPTTLGDYLPDYTPPEPLNGETILRLRLRNTNIGDQGVQRLANCRWAKRLEALDISQCRVVEEETYVSLKKLKSLKALSISGNGASAAALAGWSGLKKLEHLELAQTTDAETLAVLFPKPSRLLKRLRLVGAKAVLANPNGIRDAAQALLELNMGSTSMGDKVLLSLLEFDSVQTLTELSLYRCSLSDKSIDALVKSPLNRLVHLDISSNKLTDHSLKQLADWEGLQHVTHLRTRNNRKLTSEGYQALIDCERFRPVCLDVGKSKDESLGEALADRFGDAVICE